MQTFKKIRITSKDKSNQKIDKLLEERSANSDRTKLDQCIAQLSYERNRKLIVDQVTEMSDNACNFSRVKMWKVKQKVCPNIQTSNPEAKVDKNGDLISNRADLKSLYCETYKDRLQHRVIKPNYTQLKDKKQLHSLATY